MLFLGFAVLLLESLLARYVGIYDLLGFTCDASEKAALMEFPQYGGKVTGEDIKGPLGGEALISPRCKLRPLAASWRLRPGKHPWIRSLLTARRS